MPTKMFLTCLCNTAAWVKCWTNFQRWSWKLLCLLNGVTDLQLRLDSRSQSASASPASASMLVAGSLGGCRMCFLSAVYCFKSINLHWDVKLFFKILSLAAIMWRKVFNCSENNTTVQWLVWKSLFKLSEPGLRLWFHLQMCGRPRHINNMSLPR